ncbi:carbohydrate-binding protein [Halalkalibacterium halodurans]|uniref:carbohydrate-binding protein n=1 Tax=Halalkalibacterium halodurans TaxID=86665 RepID=UPI0023ECB77F|nr:carbohydrate-binding protein [Halalkalibacterium halodurans]
MIHPGGRIEIRTGSPTGTLLGDVQVPNTGGWQEWQTVTGNVQIQPGTYDVYLVFKGSPEYDLMNVNWFVFRANGQGNGDSHTHPDYTAGIRGITGNEVTIFFAPTTEARYVDVHLKVNNGQQLNYRMTERNGEWERVVENLSSGDVLEYSFTYEKLGPQYTTEWFTYTR